MVKRYVITYANGQYSSPVVWADVLYLIKLATMRGGAKWRPMEVVEA